MGPAGGGGLFVGHRLAVLYQVELVTWGPVPASTDSLSPRLSCWRCGCMNSCVSECTFVSASAL